MLQLNNIDKIYIPYCKRCNTRIDNNPCHCTPLDLTDIEFRGYSKDFDVKSRLILLLADLENGTIPTNLTNTMNNDFDRGIREGYRQSIIIINEYLSDFFR